MAMALLGMVSENAFFRIELRGRVLLVLMIICFHAFVKLRRCRCVRDVWSRHNDSSAHLGPEI